MQMQTIQANTNTNTVALAIGQKAESAAQLTINIKSSLFENQARDKRGNIGDWNHYHSLLFSRMILHEHSICPLKKVIIPLKLSFPPKTPTNMVSSNYSTKGSCIGIT